MSQMTPREIVQELDTDVVYIDAADVDANRFGRKVKLISKKTSIQIVSEHKADDKYVIVGAASIIAKSKREKEIKKIKKTIGVDFGSGYPSDPITKKFLSQYAKKHKADGIFRQTWATWKNHIKKKEQKKLGEFKK